MLQFFVAGALGLALASTLASVVVGSDSAIMEMLFVNPSSRDVEKNLGRHLMQRVDNEDVYPGGGTVFHGNADEDCVKVLVESGFKFAGFVAEGPVYRKSMPSPGVPFATRNVIVVCSQHRLMAKVTNSSL